jgi:hypothetical protein
LDEAKNALLREQQKKKQDAKDEPLSFNLTKGFVTFNSRRDAELAKMMKFTYESDQYVVEIPPDPSDILWADLQMNPLHAWIMSIAGYACIAGVFWAYLPTVVAIAYYTSLETLAEYSATFKSMADDPSTAALWDGLVNALALQLLMGFVPTFFHDHLLHLLLYQVRKFASAQDPGLVLLFPSDFRVARHCYRLFIVGHIGRTRRGPN